MVLSRPVHKIERVTITLVPTGDERSFRHVPSTFSPANRRYSWRHYEAVDYMIVPKKISSREVTVEMFIDATKKKRMMLSEIQKMVHQFVNAKIASEWDGLKLANISRATAAAPPRQSIQRGTIEEILGTNLGK